MQHVIILLLTSNELAQVILEMHILVGTERNDALFGGQQFYQVVLVRLLFMDVHEDLVVVILVDWNLRAKLLVNFFLQRNLSEMLQFYFSISGRKGTVHIVVGNFLTLYLNHTVLYFVILFLRRYFQWDRNILATFSGTFIISSLDF